MTPGLLLVRVLTTAIDRLIINKSGPSLMDIYEQIVELRKQGRRGAVATIVNVRGSIPSFQTAKMLVRDDGSILGTIGGGCVEADVWQAAREVMESENPRTLKFDLNQDPKYDTGLVCGGTLEVFIEPVLPPALLYVFGAGHVAVHLCQAAANAGFDVVVSDDRSSYATQERFPAAREVHALDFDEATQKLDPNESSSIVVVTRGHRDDMRVLRWAVQTRARLFAGRAGHRRDHSGRDRSRHHCGVDRDPAAHSRRAAPYELVQDHAGKTGRQFRPGSGRDQRHDRKLDRRRRTQALIFVSTSAFRLTDILSPFCYCPWHVPRTQLRRSYPGRGRIVTHGRGQSPAALATNHARPATIQGHFPFCGHTIALVLHRFHHRGCGQERGCSGAGRVRGGRINRG